MHIVPSVIRCQTYCELRCEAEIELHTARIRNEEIGEKKNVNECEEQSRERDENREDIKRTMIDIENSDATENKKRWKMKSKSNTNGVKLDSEIICQFDFF